MVDDLVKEINSALWLVVKVLGLIGMISSNNATNKVKHLWITNKYII
jgi:hypothetical protein